MLNNVLWSFLQWTFPNKQNLMISIHWANLNYLCLLCCGFLSILDQVCMQSRVVLEILFRQQLISHTTLCFSCMSSFAKVINFQFSFILEDYIVIIIIISISVPIFHHYLKYTTPKQLIKYTTLLHQIQILLLEKHVLQEMEDILEKFTHATGKERLVMHIFTDAYLMWMITRHSLALLDTLIIRCLYKLLSMDKY